ncbi:hypothetical protein DPMN_014636 [Dreissena polymorpha]|uniref:Uncharacterized protein n=1 Tax=Dreissena polymorpha TaxID=45954 RepID=A0A9D4S3M6_DREPO|nr:hypothetical protein DPMN_014636 [Dreissena polymorpha]
MVLQTGVIITLWIKLLEVLAWKQAKPMHRLAGADRSSNFFLKVKGLSFSITKEGGVE